MPVIRAQAPGKLVVCGDFAVLHGAPAVVIALDCMAQADIENTTDNRFHLSAPNLQLDDVVGELRQSKMHWPGQQDADKLKLVTALLEQLTQAGKTPGACRLTLDTTRFFDAASGTKLGLGSSTALIVALTAALAKANQWSEVTLSEQLAIHRAMQGGRGSGLDIASALLGGSLVYRLHNDMPDATPLTWPYDLHWRVIWSGKAASTGHFLKRLSAWQAAQAAAHAQHFGQLCTTAEAITQALQQQASADALHGIAEYAHQLDALGQAAHIDIVTAEHRKLADLATQSGVVYKTSGAGGGDIGVAFSQDQDALADFVDNSRNAGFRPLDLRQQPQGVRLTTTPEKEP